jgi:SAM-dependent methyltransferase
MVWNSYSIPESIDHLTNKEAVIRARVDFLSKRPRNLEFLFRKRFEWMNEYVEGKSVVIDLGSGLGFSREFIRNPKLLLTDINDYPWIDRQVDALAPPFEDESVDVFICSHIVHHLAHPMVFFESITRMLKPGGYLVIQELETSLMLKVLLRFMKNEGWNNNVDVFNRNSTCTDSDPWSANCAIPHLLFSSPEKFTREVGGLRLIRNELSECLIFPVSGGVLAKVRVPTLPLFALKAIDSLDNLAVSLLPGLFALGRRVVLQKD